MTTTQSNAAISTQKEIHPPFDGDIFDDDKNENPYDTSRSLNTPDPFFELQIIDAIQRICSKDIDHIITTYQRENDLMAKMPTVAMQDAFSSIDKNINQILNSLDTKIEAGDLKEYLQESDYYLVKRVI